MTNSYEKPENSENLYLSLCIIQIDEHVEITGERTEDSHLSDTHI